MIKIIWEQLTLRDGVKYWAFYDQGSFSAPIMLLDDYNAKKFCREVARVMRFEEMPEALRAHRHRHKKTQQDLADALGISRNYVSLIERGKADNMTLKLYQKITEFLMGG